MLKTKKQKFLKEYNFQNVTFRGMKCCQKMMTWRLELQ